MNLFQILFSTPLPIVGFRIISVLSYLIFFLIAWRKTRGVPNKRRFTIAFFFCVFTVMLSDWGWTFAQNSRWRFYVPPTLETPWLQFQPWIIAAPFRDYFRVPMYLYCTAIAVYSLRPYFKSGLLSFNRWVAFSYCVYLMFWLALVWLAPNPLYGDLGLWKLWPKLAAETGRQVFYQTIFLADGISRFLLNSLCALSWWG